MAIFNYALTSLLAVLLCWGSCIIPYTAGQADNLGTEFVLVFMQNDVETPMNLPLELFITTPRTIPVLVEITTPGYTEASAVNMRTTVVSGQVEKIELSHLLRLRWTSLEKKVVYIHSDNEIAVYALNKERYSTDGFLLYPTDVIGYEYYTVSHTPTSSYTVFAIASKFANTHISITFPQNITGSPIRALYNGQTYTNGNSFNITLQAFESFQCLAEDQADLTGTHIQSSMPIAVFSGNVRTWVGSRTSRDHLAVQLPPVQAYGKIFPIIPTPGRTVGDYIRVVAWRDGTQLQVEGPPPRYFTLTKAGEYVDFEVPSDKPSTVSSDHPVLVVQLTQSKQSDDEPADPTMSVITSRDQYMADYVFSTPQYSQGGSYDNWLMLAARSYETDGLMIDNRPLSELSPVWTPIPGTILSGTQVQISQGAHAIRHMSPVAVFSGYVYGTADKESYSFQIGTRMAPINQPCTATETVFGDGVDNDCDGNIDEELCTGSNRNLDTDGDGLVSEDCAISRDVIQGVPDSGGRQFLIFFMENVVDSPRFVPLEIHVTPIRSAAVTVQVESPRWFEPEVWLRKAVKFGVVETFHIPYTMRVTGSSLTSKALFITADHDVAVYAVNRELYSADAFLALPIDVLGKQYYAVTHWPNSVSSRCQIGVIGVSDGTLVDITFPSVGDRGVMSVEFNAQTYTNGDTLSVVLNRFSTLQLQSSGDLTGTLVKSTQRVAVLSGNIRTSVGSGSSRDHLAAMLPPTDSWGKFYCTVPIPGRTTGDYFYILAAEDDTLVELTNGLTFTLNSGQHRLVVIPSMEYVAIQAAKPILVTQISQSQQSTMEPGDPTMIILPSQEQWANAYTFSTTQSSYSASSQVLYENYLVMVIEGDQVDGLLFDGKSVPSLFTTWFPVTGTNYTGTSFLIAPGVHTLQHIDPTVTFSVIVYGNADKESYGFPAGMRLAPINAPCESRPTVAGDGVDNDCDGRIDEEICDDDGPSSDSDGDGLYNEDCAIYIEPVTQPPTTSPDLFTGVISTDSTTTTAPNGSPANDIPIWMIVGPPGPPGVVGPQGMPGPQGNPGLNGIPGNPGRDGRDGSDGDVGQPGLVGATGATGATGIQGPLGDNGITGATGPQGLPGPVGNPGETGMKGEPGISLRGDSGLPGLTGAPGVTGMTGAAGAPGLTGINGETGLPGQTGPVGAKGDKGSKGAAGAGYIDENECLAAPCSHTCTNTIGSFYCSCPKGFELDDSKLNCGDTNECLSFNGGCGDQCVNTVGSFYCLCTNSGYGLAADIRSCVDVDECSLGTDRCNSSQSCINGIGGYACIGTRTVTTTAVALKKTASAVSVSSVVSCPTGSSRTTTGSACEDVNECLLDNGGCLDLCENLDGSFLCKCSFGYTISDDSRSCLDEDECAIDGRHRCTDDQVCINSVGSYHCLDTTAGSASVSAQESDQLSSSLLMDSSELVDGNIVLGLLIWLIVLTLLLLILAILLIRQCIQLNSAKRNFRDDIRDAHHTALTTSADHDSRPQSAYSF